MQKKFFKCLNNSKLILKSMCKQYITWEKYNTQLFCINDVQCFFGHAYSCLDCTISWGLLIDWLIDRWVIESSTRSFGTRSMRSWGAVLLVPSLRCGAAWTPGGLQTLWRSAEQLQTPEWCLMENPMFSVQLQNKPEAHLVWNISCYGISNSELWGNDPNQAQSIRNETKKQLETCTRS